MANASKEKAYWLKCGITGFLETWWLTLLGWPYGNEEIVLSIWVFSINDGSEIRFQEDRWLGTTMLRERYPALYNIVLGCHKSDMLAKVLEAFPPNVKFRRDIVGPRLASWNELLQHLALVNLTQGTDEF